MEPLTKEQASMVVETVRVAMFMKQPLAEYVAQAIGQFEAAAETYRRKAFEGGRVKRSRLGWKYEENASRMANNARMMRELRERFASWRSPP